MQKLLFAQSARKFATRSLFNSTAAATVTAPHSVIINNSFFNYNKNAVGALFGNSAQQQRFKKSKSGQSKQKKIEPVTEEAIEEAGEKAISLPERAISLLGSNKQLQLTSSNPETGLPNSSLVPFVVFPKTMDTDMMFSELAFSAPKVDEQQAPQEEGVDEAHEFSHLNMVFMTHKSSKHNDQLAPQAQVSKGPKAALSKEAQTAKDELGNFIESVKQDIGTNVSFTVGFTDVEITNLFKKAGKRYPPRAVFIAEVQRIPQDNPIFQKMWKEHFQQHPHVSVGVKSSDVNMFKVGKVKTAYYIEISGEMHPIEPVQQFTSAEIDPLSSFMRPMMARLNKDEEFLDKLCNQGYDIHLAEKFVYSIDRYGISVLGREGEFIPKKQRRGMPQEVVSPEAWATYFLTFGETVSTEAELRNYLLEFTEAK